MRQTKMPAFQRYVAARENPCRGGGVGLLDESLDERRGDRSVQAGAPTLM